MKKNPAVPAAQAALSSFGSSPTVSPVPASIADGGKVRNEVGDLICRSCSDIWRSPATHIANAYGGRHEEGSSWDWPVCQQHMPFAMCAGWFPIREISEEPPFDPNAYIKGKTFEQRKAPETPAREQAS